MSSRTDGLRCQYHGWKFDETGACVDQPFEDTTHPEDNFKAKCGIAGYPVQELADWSSRTSGRARCPCCRAGSR